MYTETAAAPATAKAHRVSRLSTRLFSFPAAILAILVGKAFWTCRERIVDPDIWWHLRNAQYIVTHGRFPTVDSYSFTAAGSAWLDHSWLPELLYYSAYHALGLRGLFVVFTLTVAVLYVAIFSLCMKQTGDPLAAAVATIFGGLLAMVGFTPRAQNFGWLCFIAIYAILLYFRTARRAPLWLLPALFCLWINCHAAWPFGLVVFGIVLGSGLIRRDIGQLAAAPWTTAEIRKLIVTLAASVAALFVNPFGYRLVLYPFDVAFRQNLNVAFGGEWASVNFNDSRGIFVMVALGAVFAMMLLGRKRWRIDDALLTAFVLYCGLAHIRFLLPAGILLPPILAPQLGKISSYDPGHERPLLNAAVITAVIALMVFGFPTPQVLDAQVQQFFPVAAVRYLSTHPQDGNMFNMYEWGGYLEWNLPQAPTFIDSRTDIFEYRGVVKHYFDMSTFNDSQELLDSYHIFYVLYPAGTPLSYFLSKSPQWERIYGDNLAVIYRRVR
jgi:hypothetical protein